MEAQQTPTQSEQPKPAANILEAWHESMRPTVAAMLHELNATIEAGQVMQRIAPVDGITPGSVFAEALAEQKPQDGYYVLDVGCGLSSRVGRKHGGVPVHVIGADPIAYPIQQALHGARMRQPHPIINVTGEELALVWAPESFHLVYTNALLHTASPRRTVEQMARLLRPGASALVVLPVEPTDALWTWQQDEGGGAVTCRNRFGDVQLLPAQFRSARMGDDSLLLHYYRPSSGLVLASH